MARLKTTAASDRSDPVDLSRMRHPPTHPGDVLLKEFLEPFGHGAQARAARAMGMSTVRLNEVCLGKRPVTAETAILIGALTTTSPQLWLHLQADYDLWHLMQKMDTTNVQPLLARP